jgi:S1-C subfamily serine protease
MLKRILLFGAALAFSQCATIFLPAKQKISINVNSDNSTIYLDSAEVGKNSIQDYKVEKDGAKQIMVKKNGYKTHFDVLMPVKRPTAYWFLQVPNPAWLIGIGFWWDSYNPKSLSYEKTKSVAIDKKQLNLRKEDQKYLLVEKEVLFKQKNLEKIDIYEAKYGPDYMSLLKKSDKTFTSRYVDNYSAEVTEKNGHTISRKLEELIHNTGYIDTVHVYFPDKVNTLKLAPRIDKYDHYVIYGKRSSMHRAKTDITWLIKNTYGEITDSVSTSSVSDAFNFDFGFPEPLKKIRNENRFRLKKHFTYVCSDAVLNGYLELQNNQQFQQLLKKEKEEKIPVASLNIDSKNYLTEREDAFNACVTIKTNEGHASGFAISNSGYILTAYHVVAGKIKDQFKPLTIITADKSEYQGTVVRYSKGADLALIKIERAFEKCFRLSGEKNFTAMENVITIGTPKSVELGMSSSSGIISGSRVINNNNLLQLNMSVNSGNSGGPVIGAKGSVIGVILSKASGLNTEGICFAATGYLISKQLNLTLIN